MLFHYLKYFLFHIVSFVSACVILLGGDYITWSLVVVLLVYTVGDLILGDDTSLPEYKHPGVLTFQLWLALPMLCFVMLVCLWSISSTDILGFGASLQQLTGYDFLAAREATHWVHHVSVFIITGLYIGLIGTITGHELTHRTWDPISMVIGRWLLSFSFDTGFAIEHVFGHHVYVSTINDPATAPRGRNVYHHIVESTITGNISAWHIEKNRLAKRGSGPFTWKNGYIRGNLMSVLLVCGIFYATGFATTLFFIGAALWGKALLEIVNYMEHYGMVRLPEVPVQPRHSWNTNKRISSWGMFNLTRHSHHHADGNVPYHKLKAYPEAPEMISGYLANIILTLLPPLWNKLMIPKLLKWDETYASPEELKLAREANANSGIKALIEANKKPLYQVA